MTPLACALSFGRASTMRRICEGVPEPPPLLPSKRISLSKAISWSVFLLVPISDEPAIGCELRHSGVP
eukprot:CAMPEP_0205940444 /NCGR_PEP_ID=MMETSP1325-20131115/52369_1 /ASSEMBLY_ACC=CAM_ASM_000708 /TAXON_ID=236786 /ORGANISM="Florenciella sp., Strain RCC1007" /LENGTH=67 /DNA_ID=CAMNT_0053310991 /DNA_START=21 /DNA_END=221 /DNA_ORIENTATION=+